MNTNTRLLTLAERSVNSIISVFLGIAHELNVLKHVNECHNVKKALAVLTTALQRRSQFGEKHMRLGGEKWHEQLTERLDSSQRTLQKLNGFSEKITGRRLTGNTVERIYNKLPEYVRKLLNLASKFNSMFDRLKKLQLYEQLTQAHDEAQDARHELSRDMTKWAELKIRRAELRLQLNMLNNCRRTSLIS